MLKTLIEVGLYVTMLIIVVTALVSAQILYAFLEVKSNQIKFIWYTRSQNTNRKLENKDIKRT